MFLYKKYFKNFKFIDSLQNFEWGIMLINPPILKGGGTNIQRGNGAITGDFFTIGEG